MERLLAFFGYFPKSKLIELQAQNDSLKKMNADYNALIFDFDSLLKNYGNEQLNSLFYKLINLVRNDANKKYLLDRWVKRVNGALESMGKVS